MGQKRMQRERHGMAAKKSPGYVCTESGIGSYWNWACASIET